MKYMLFTHSGSWVLLCTFRNVRAEYESGTNNKKCNVCLTLLEHFHNFKCKGYFCLKCGVKRIKFA